MISSRPCCPGLISRPLVQRKKQTLSSTEAAARYPLDQIMYEYMQPGKRAARKALEKTAHAIAIMEGDAGGRAKPG